MWILDDGRKHLRPEEAVAVDLLAQDHLFDAVAAWSMVPGQQALSGGCSRRAAMLMAARLRYLDLRHPGVHFDELAKAAEMHAAGVEPDDAAMTAV